MGTPSAPRESLLGCSLPMQIRREHSVITVQLHSTGRCSTAQIEPRLRSPRSSDRPAGTWYAPATGDSSHKGWHMRRGSRLLTCGGVAVIAVTVTVLSAQERALTPEQMGEFLRTAEIVNSERTRKGLTQPWRLTLSDGRMTHDRPFSR